MREGINSGRPRANFPRKILKGRRKKQPLSRKIETFLEICKRKTRDFTSTMLILVWVSCRYASLFGALSKKLYAFKTP